MSSIDQPGKVANPARGRLNRANEYFPVSVRACAACEFGLARRVWPSRPASSLLFLHAQAESGAYSRDSFLFPRRLRPSSYTAIRHRVSLYYIIVHQVTQLRIDGVPCRESAGTGPVVLKVVPVTGAAFSGITMGQLIMCNYLSYIHSWYEVGMMCDTENIRGGIHFNMLEVCAFPPFILLST